MKEPPFLIGHTIEMRVPLDSDVLNDNWHNWYNDFDTTRHNSHGIFPIDRTEELRIVHATMARRDTIQRIIRLLIFPLGTSIVKQPTVTLRASY